MFCWLIVCSGRAVHTLPILINWFVLWTLFTFLGKFIVHHTLNTFITLLGLSIPLLWLHTGNTFHSIPSRPRNRALTRICLGVEHFSIRAQLPQNTLIFVNVIGGSICTLYAWVCLGVEISSIWAFYAFPVLFQGSLFWTLHTGLS